MTNIDKVRTMVKSYGNTPFTTDQVIIATGLSRDQVTRAMRDAKVAGMVKRADGRFQVKGRAVK